jgi:signal transduction histidine kinase
MESIEIDEEPCVLIATADITESKLVEAHSKLTKELIQAQEEEWARVNWELHHHIDDLILVSIVLDRPSTENPDSATEIPRAARQQLEDVVSRLLDLWHRLYPAKLEYLGLAAAAASFCKELSEAQKKRIDFHSANVPTELPHDISLCLYRVLQEALQNAIKYSGSHEFEVSLIRESNEIHLQVRACGVGFDTTVASQSGFDLLSVKQRLKLVDGEFSIESQPQCGTTINARLPMQEWGKSKTVT